MTNLYEIRRRKVTFGNQMPTVIQVQVDLTANPAAPAVSGSGGSRLGFGPIAAAPLGAQSS